MFDTTVCGKCLTDAFYELKTIKPSLAEKAIQVIGVAAIHKKKDESHVIGFQKSGEADFPFLFINETSLYNAFNLETKTFLDTPFFLFTDNNFKILSVFKPEQYRTKELQ